VETDANPGQPSSIPPYNKARYRYDRGPPFRGIGTEDRDIYTEAGRPEMSRYTVFFEPTATGYSAYVPDLPGCVAAASSLDETRQLIKEAIEFHIEGMRMHGESVPEPTNLVEQVDVSA
jgi:predicted RNase H-like HicB family nuclease